MKILVATNPKMGNPYTRTLMEAVKDCYRNTEIDIDTDTFYDEAVFGYDIVHVMFPHELIHNRKFTSIEALKERFVSLKAKGVKIVSTCHNFTPHYSKDDKEKQAYDITYSESDMILHLAPYSQDIFRQNYPQAINAMLYHHTYDTIYNNGLSQSEARERLKLNDGQRYLLAFGIIRSDQERKLLRQLSKDLPQDIKLWVPSFYRVNKSRNPIKYMRNMLRYIIHKNLNRNIEMQYDYVSHEDLPLYFQAADAVLIPRKEILNSGNLPLAYYFGKPVAGPTVGNVGYILTHTKNYGFDPNDPKSVCEKSIEAINAPETGKQNKAYAQLYFSSRRVAQCLYQYYKEILGQ